MIGNKVTKLHTRFVFNDIMSYLKNRGLESEKTKEAYEADIRQFFKFMRNGKEIEHLQPEDLYITRSEMLEYKEILSKKEILNQYRERYDIKSNSDKENSKATVNRKLSSIKTIFDELSITYPEIQMKIFKSIRYKKVQGKSWGSLSWDQTAKMIELAKELPQGEEKNLIIEVAARTGYRITEVLSITWDHIKLDGDLWVIEVIAKGGDIEQVPIKQEFYERLSVLKTKDYPDNQVFGIHKRTCQRMIKELCVKLGIEENQNIKFHSLKKMGINETLDQSNGNVQRASIFGKHKRIDTTMRYYAQKQKDFKNHPALMIGETIDLSPFEELSKEQLLELIQKSSNGVKMALLNRL